LSVTPGVVCPAAGRAAPRTDRLVIANPKVSLRLLVFIFLSLRSI
jgi:hypothetical protein